MLVTQKCQYALRAVFELARRGDQRPVKIAQIAEEQNIPFRFLEVILSQLKQAGFVESRRGTEGGYLLAQSPAQLTVGDIVRFIDGSPISAEPTDPPARKPARAPLTPPTDVFGTIWQEAAQAVFNVFDGVTINDLLERDKHQREQYVPHYDI